MVLRQGKGICLDCVSNKIYINGNKLTSKDVFTQTETIQVLRVMLKYAGEPVRNNQLPPSSYTKNKNQMMTKVIQPFCKVIKKYADDDLDRECEGKMGIFYCRLDQRFNTMFYIVDKKVPVSSLGDNWRIQKDAYNFLEHLDILQKKIHKAVSDNANDFFALYNKTKGDLFDSIDSDVLTYLEDNQEYRFYCDIFCMFEKFYRQLTGQSCKSSLSLIKTIPSLGGKNIHFAKIGSGPGDTLLSAIQHTYPWYTTVGITHDAYTQHRYMCLAKGHGLQSLSPDEKMYLYDCVLLDGCILGLEQKAVFLEIFPHLRSGTKIMYIDSFVGLSRLFYRTNTIDVSGLDCVIVKKIPLREKFLQANVIIVEKC